MIYITLKSSNILFKLLFCILLFKCHTAAPINSSVTYDKFMEEIIRDECSFPAEVSLPFSSRATFEYLATPLKICKAPHATERSLEAIQLCSEIFDTLKNVTCHLQTTQLPKIEVSFSEDVCNDVRTLTFSNQTESFLKHLKDTFICKIMCDAEFLPACTVLLWTYEVQKQIEGSENGLQLKENKEVAKPTIKNKVHTEKTIVEETKLIRVNLTNGKGELDGKIVDNQNPSTAKDVSNYKDSQQNELQDTDNVQVVPSAVENENFPLRANDTNFKGQKNINPVVLSKSEDVLTSIKKQNQSVSNLQQDHQTLEETKETVNTKQSSEVENKSKSTGSEGIKKTDDKVVAENEVSIQGISPEHNENNELPQIANNKISSEAKDVDITKKEKAQTNSSKDEPKKDILLPNADNHFTAIQADKNEEIEPKKVDLSKEGKANFPYQDANDQVAAEIPKQKSKDLTKNTELKVVTVPESPSLPTEPIVQPVPTQQKNAESPKNAEITETGIGESTFTTIADLEKMEEGNEIPESINKDQDTYNDDGFFEPPKSKQPDELNPAKSPDSVIEGQNDLSKYPAFPARNSIGQSADDIQVIPAFPEQEDSHFFFYFLSIILILMAGYLLFHNKQKIIALIVEGRHERRRRSHGVGYKKLDTK